MARREDPLDVHVPDPVATATADHPEEHALLADSVGLALLVVLDTLSPAERLAFVLHDIFAVPFEQIGPVMDRSPAAAKQLASRARHRLSRDYCLSRGRSRQAARGGRRLPGRRPRGGLRGPAIGPRPGRGAPRRRGRPPGQGRPGWSAARQR